MKREVSIVIPGEPVSQGRPRFSTHGGFARAYDPKKSREGKQSVKYFADAAMLDAGIGVLIGPIGMQVQFGIKLPKSLERKRKPVHRKWRIKKPDLDNMIKLVKDTIDSKKYHSLQFKKDRISYLRALAIGVLINEAVDIFLENEEAILNGSFEKSLLDKCKYEAQINDIIKISVDKIYKSKDVIEKEVAGYKIIADLLDVFTTALNNKFKGTQSNYDKLVLNLLPKEFQQEKEKLYDRIMQICGYIASLSDGFAIRLYKKIKGNII